MKYLLPFLFFSIYFLFASWHYNDFGVSTDEAMNNQNARVSAKFVLKRIMPSWADWYEQHSSVYRETQELRLYNDRFYGVAFDLPVFVLQKAFGINDLYDRFRFKHFCTFLLFFISSIYFYKIIKWLHNRMDWALLATLFYILHPRLFAESFYNPKDLPLLALFTISIYFLLRFVEEKTLRRAIPFALIGALTTDLRILGVLLPLVATGIFVYDAGLAAIKNQGVRLFFKSFFQQLPQSFWVFFPLFLLGIVGFWPLLWHNPLFFFEAFSYMSHYPWRHNTLFMGESVFAPNNPWYFPLVWIGITTPILYLLAWVFGIGNTARQVFENKGILYKNKIEQANIVAILLSIAPLVLIILIHSVLYDGWRQLYFLYPAACLLGINAFAKLNELFPATKNWLFPTFFGLAIGHAAFQIMQTYPYSNVYFNTFANDPVHRYEVDYWGLSYREGLNYLAKTAPPDSNITISSTAQFVCYELNSLPLKDSKRFDCKPYDPEYYLTEFRGARYDKAPAPNYTEIYSKTVNGMKIMAVFKRMNNDHHFYTAR